MQTISDLPGDLVEEEIFSRVPLTCLRSVRSTCKNWNALSKKLILGKAAAAEAARKQFMGFMIMDNRVCFMKFDLEGIREDQNLVGPSIKQVSILDQIGISIVIHCDGLLLCVIEDLSRLLVWNPYLGQTRWIQPRTKFDETDRYSLGYDSNGNHKILRFCFHRSGRKHVWELEIYDFSSNSWKVLDVTMDWEFAPRFRFASLKGNIYFPAKKATVRAGEARKEEDFLLCFDCTTESFGRRLPMPFNSDGTEGIFASLSCVRQEQLALLYQRWETHKTIEFCVTDKIEPNAVSWRKFLITFNGFLVHPYAGSFFIDEEKKVAVVFDLDASPSHRYLAAHIVGEDGSLRSVNIGDAPDPTALGECTYYTKGYCLPLVCSSYVPSLVPLQINQPDKSSYVPSLVQLQINQPDKWKERDYYSLSLLQYFVCFLHLLPTISLLSCVLLLFII